VTADDPTKKRILEAALRLFATRGYRGSTIRMLASELGLTSAALYYHFPNKAACLHSVVAPYVDEMEGVIDSHTVAATPESDRGFLGDVATIMARNRDLTRLIHREPAVADDPELAPRLRDINQALRSRLTGDEPSDIQRLRADAAIESIRGPVLRSQIDVRPHVDVLVDMAMDLLHRRAS
jgi:AcrR family transcriptional regulator